MTNLSASNTGNKLSSAVSLGSLNQLLIGMALSKNKSRVVVLCELKILIGILGLAYGSILSCYLGKLYTRQVNYQE